MGHSIAAAALPGSPLAAAARRPAGRRARIPFRLRGPAGDTQSTDCVIFLLCVILCDIMILYYA